MTFKTDWEYQVERREQQARDRTREAAAYATVRFHAAMLAEAAPEIWNLGDGCGGSVMECIKKALEANGCLFPARRSGSGAKRKLPTKKVLAVARRHGFQCAYCSCELDEETFTVDHKVPVSKGGTDDLENLVPACRSCNSSKGAR